MARSTFSRQHRILMALLRDIRLEAQLTQSELAEQLRRPQSYVSKYEIGDRRLDLIELHEVADACGITLNELVARYLAGLKER